MALRKLLNTLACSLLAFSSVALAQKSRVDQIPTGALFDGEYSASYQAEVTVTTNNNEVSSLVTADIFIGENAFRVDGEVTGPLGNSVSSSVIVNWNGGVARIATLIDAPNLDTCTSVAINLPDFDSADIGGLAGTAFAGFPTFVDFENNSLCKLVQNAKQRVTVYRASCPALQEFIYRIAVRANGFPRTTKLSTSFSVNNFNVVISLSVRWSGFVQGNQPDSLFEIPSNCNALNKRDVHAFNDAEALPLSVTALLHTALRTL